MGDNTNTDKNMVPFNRISIDEEFNSRKTFTKIEELASSIDQAGLAQPLVVREGGADKNGNRMYFLIAGGRRYRAIKLLRDPNWAPLDADGNKVPRKTTPASWVMVPVRKVKGDSQQNAALNLIENMHREDLPPLEQAEAIQHYLEMYDISQAELAKRLSVSEPFISQRLALLRNTSDEVKEALANGEVTSTQVRELVRLPKEAQQEVLKQARAKGGKISVEAVKEIADEKKEKLGIKRDKQSKKKSAEPVYDTEKVAAAKELYADKEINLRPKTLILEQIGALKARLDNPKTTEEARGKNKHYLAALEFVLGLREAL